jgi:metal-sulfur cluster biosynthetic enzyme
VGLPEDEIFDPEIGIVLVNLFLSSAASVF